jgi:hypothetical protein
VKLQDTEKEEAEAQGFVPLVFVSVLTQDLEL